MASNFEDGAIECGSHEAGCPYSTIAIKIKTLGCQINAVQVDEHQLTLLPSSGNTQSRRVRPVPLLVLDNPQMDLPRIFSTLNSSQIAIQEGTMKKLILGYHLARTLLRETVRRLRTTKSQCHKIFQPTST
ncbi:hypothetical protein AB3S75_018783 [Citrus x aurantiifolia]